MFDSNRLIPRLWRSIAGFINESMEPFRPPVSPLIYEKLLLLFFSKVESDFFEDVVAMLFIKLSIVAL